MGGIASKNNARNAAPNLPKSRYFLYINYYSEKREKVKRRPRYFRALLRRGDGKIGRSRRKLTGKALRLRKKSIISNVGACESFWNLRWKSKSLLIVAEILSTRF